MPSKDGVPRDPWSPIAEDATHLVLVHLGDQFAPHMPDCAAQALDIDPHLVLWVLASRKYSQRFPEHIARRMRFVPIESLEPSAEHKRFSRHTTLDGKFLGGIWKYATERFFVIEELMRAYDLPDCFHCENDNLLYARLSDLRPLMRRLYPGLAVTLDNDNRCIPGFMYFGCRNAAGDLVRFLDSMKSGGENDMVTLAAFYQRSRRDQIDSLPIVPPSFNGDWTTPSGFRSSSPFIFSNHAVDFDSVFDAAALGQYLTGIDSRITDKKNTVGFINESCVFNPSMFKYEWRDVPGVGRVPYLGYEGTWYKINNLHVHSKSLRAFRSRT